MDFYILIVDDEYPIREWLVHMLRSNRPQYYVESAENGQEALEKLHLKSFDLVITDIRMPHMDGVELLKNISAYFPGTGTIVLSSYDDYNYVRSTFKYDATDYLLKTDIDTDEFLESIDNFFQSKNSSGDMEHYAREIQKLLIEESGTVEQLLSLLSSYAGYTPSDSSFCVLLKYNASDDIQKPYYPNVKETSFRFSLCLTQGIFIGCIDLASQPSLLTQLQLQSIYLKQLQKYNHLSLLLYTNILSLQSNLLLEMRRLYLCRNLNFYQIETYNSSMHPDYHGLQIKEQYFTIRKTLFTSDSKTLLPQIESFLECAHRNLYTDTEDLKFMCLKIYESSYLNFPASDLAEYSRHMQKISGLISRAESWDKLKDVFVTNLSELFHRSFGNSTNLSPRIARAVSIIEKNYMNPLTLVSVADDLHVNPEYLSRSFKKEVGINFNNYLNNIRLQQALALLRNPQILISEIAIETGFQTPAYFSKCFKASFGMSPQEWRNQNN